MGATRNLPSSLVAHNGPTHLPRTHRILHRRRSPSGPTSPGNRTSVTSPKCSCSADSSNSSSSPDSLSVSASGSTYGFSSSSAAPVGSMRRISRAVHPESMFEGRAWPNDEWRVVWRVGEESATGCSV